MREILETHECDLGELLQVLIKVQHDLHFVPDEAVALISEHLRVTRGHLRGVIGFHSFLSDRYLGEYVVYVSDNITDRMQESDGLARYLGNRLRRSDVMFRRTPEAGAALQAAMLRGADETLKDIQYEEAADPSSGHAWRRGADETLKELYRSDLRGRGGAGFKAASKWETCRNISAPERYVVCNADEGEPGTFKDRVLLTSYTDLVFEGMTLSGYVVGSSRGILCIRREHWYLRPHLEAVLARRRDSGLLGRNILGTGFAFDIAIHWGAGAYICGMEMALIESLEGRRGKPRKRWPLRVDAGLHHRPTVVNNVETFAADRAAAP